MLLDSWKPTPDGQLPTNYRMKSPEEKGSAECGVTFKQTLCGSDSINEFRTTHIYENESDAE